MSDMGMDHSSHSGHSMDHSQMNHKEHKMSDDKMARGWKNANTPAGHKALSYKDLVYLGTQTKIEKPDREIEMRLGGNMERYIWTLNGKRHQDSGPINIKYGQRVRIKFINDTMMAHPMHLHGMFVQIENGQTPEKRPNKHTIIIPPGETYSVLITADEPGGWAFHCHLLYHMLSGMMTTVIVTTPGDVTGVDARNTNSEAISGGHHHVH